MSLPIAVWTTGCPVPAAHSERGSFYDMIRSCLGDSLAMDLADWDCMTREDLPEPDQVAGVIVTGSAARVATRDPWMLRVEQKLEEYRKSSTPVLGICFGHQLLGNALGGRSGTNPRGREIGTTDFKLTEDDELFAPLLAEGYDPHVVVTHLDSVLELPDGARPIGTTELEPHAAIRFAPHIWGVQFHPEMDERIIAHYIDARREDIEREGLDVAALLASLRGSPFGARLLQRFVELCSSGRQTP